MKPSVVMCFTLFFAIAARAQEGIPTVLHEIKNDRSPGSLRDMANTAQPSTGNRQVGQTALPTHSPFQSSQTDPVAQVPAGATVSVATSLDFDGLDAAQTVASGGPFVPPDTNGAVGATQFVEWVNVTFAVFDKGTGATVLGPTPGNAFWRGFGGACEARNDGDIIIQYDKLAGRWVAAQPVFVAPFMYCVAVSTTSDATGPYNRYASTCRCRTMTRSPSEISGYRSSAGAAGTPPRLARRDHRSRFSKGARRQSSVGCGS